MCCLNFFDEIPTTPPLRLAKSRLRRLLACIAPAGVSVSPFGLPAFNSGMIATGNHNFERFAALCNTPEVEPRALRAGRSAIQSFQSRISVISVGPSWYSAVTVPFSPSTRTFSVPP